MIWDILAQAFANQERDHNAGCAQHGRPRFLCFTTLIEYERSTPCTCTQEPR